MKAKLALLNFVFAPHRPAWRRYGFVFLALFFGLVARIFLSSLLGHTALPFISFFPAVAAVAYYGGFVPALLATGLSVVAANWFFFEPPYTLTVAKFDLVAMTAFVITCLIIAGAIQAMHYAKQRADAALARRIDAEAELSKDLKATTRLWEVGNQCARSEYRFEDCLGGMLEAGIEITGAKKGNIQLFDEQRGALKIVAQRGFEKPFLEFFATVRELEPSVCGTAMRCTKRVIVEDITQSEIFAGEPALAVLQTAGVRAVISTPLISSTEKFMGMLSVHFSEPHTPSTREMQLLDLLTRQAADYLERSQIDDALRAAHAQLGNRAIQLEALVNERTSKLQEMVNELEHISYAIVHDLRAPLRAMNTFAETMLEELSANPQSSPHLRDYCRRIVVAAGRLDKLIQDSLSYTSAVLKESPLHPVNLGQLVPEIIETYPNLSRDKAEIRIASSLPVVMGDESLLTQCFSNLLGNAVKFVQGGARAKVSVQAKTSDGLARITVKDNGIGIPAEAQHRLFGMFERLISGYEGTGIGLAIVRKVVERMGGQVGVESEPGKGSCFWVELRLAKEGGAVGTPT